MRRGRALYPGPIRTTPWPCVTLLVAVAFVALQPVAFGGPGHSVGLIDDFESATALQSWRFESRPEAPAGSPAESSAVTGGLALGPGHLGQGAVLQYRLSCERVTQCGAYAAALWRPDSPLPKKKNAAISLWIRFAPDVQLSFITRDTSGQTLRFPFRATLERPKAGGWQFVVIPLTAKASGEKFGEYEYSGEIKGRLTEVGIVVQVRFKTHVQGSLSFDDISLLESPESFHVDRSAPVNPPAPESAELAPRLGVNIHVVRDNSALDAARGAGFQFVRMDLLWADIERSGRYRFFRYDALLRALDARGMWVLWILDYGHPDHGGGVPRTPQDVAAFGRFAEAAAAHFKGRNVRYEIWNEPDTSQFWTPSPNAAEYAILLREAVAAIHRADPSAKVSSGGVSRFDQAFLNQAIDPSLAAQLTAIGVHPYPKRGPETIAPELEQLNDWVVQGLGASVEIWDTEWGYSSADAPEGAFPNGHSEEARRRQATLAVREMLTVWTLGLPLAVWYDLRDDGPEEANPEQNYGLLDSNGNEKPSIAAVRTLTKLADSRKFIGMIRNTPVGIHAMRLDGSADTVFIVWTDQPDGRRTVEYSKQDLLSAKDIFGRAIKSKDRPSGRAQIEIDAASGPIYLLWTGGDGAMRALDVGAPRHQHR